MSDTVTIPRVVWENMMHDLAFIKKAILPLAKGYKAPAYMTTAEVLDALNIGKDRLKQIRASEQIRYRKTGRNIEYLRKDIEAYQQGNIIIPSNKKAVPTDGNS